MKNRILLFLLFLFLYSANSEGVFLKEESFQGFPLTVYYYYKENIKEINITMNNNDNVQVLKTQAFKYRENQKYEIWICIIGIPATLKPGEYSLKSEIVFGKERIVKENPIEISERNFFSEIISFSKRMSDLRKDQSERKEKERIKLYNLLREFNPEAKYFDEKFEPAVLNEARVVTAYYGDKRKYKYYNGGQADSIHYGVDIAFEENSAITACGDGKVVMAEDRLLTGHTVVIEHLPGVYSVYFHMNNIYTNPGKKVVQGEIIGSLGSTGLVTGPHLHFEIRINGEAVDPEVILSSRIIDKNLINSIIGKDNSKKRW